MPNKIKKKINNTKKSNNKTTNIKTILISFLLSRLLLIIFLIIKRDLSIFELYDSIHYIKIAQFGYSEPFLYAFFPLYPTIIRIFNIIIPSSQISGALISNVCSFLSLLIINKLTKDKENLSYILCFLFSPILAYTSIVYTESLFMLLTLLGYYLYKKDKYILSAIIVGLSIITRNSGIILWGAIGLDMLYRLFISKDKNIKIKHILAFGLISLGIGIIYPTYLYIKTGNFLEFITVQNEYWHRETGTFISSIIQDIKVLIREKETLIINIIIFLENWISFFLILILGIKIFKKDKVASIYIIVSIIAFTITYRDINYWSTLSSISLFRYIFNLFPIYLYLFDNKKARNKRIMLLVLYLLSLFNAVLIYSGIFIA